MSFPRALFRFVLLTACSLASIHACFAESHESSARSPEVDRHPALDSAGTRAFTSSGIPGDPLNIAFVGSEDELQTLMAGAQWMPADAITFRSSLRITIDSLARRPYTGAPVSSLYINGKKQDLAFEQPAANNPSKRHHVRFWRMEQLDGLGRPLWIGAATYDTRIGFSHNNGHVTHHIAAAVDEERDKLIADAQIEDRVIVSWIDNFQPDRSARNGGGDPFHTDGRLAVLMNRLPVASR
jgi:LssY C-terminus